MAIDAQIVNDAANKLNAFAKELRDISNGAIKDIVPGIPVHVSTVTSITGKITSDLKPKWTTVKAVVDAALTP